MRKLLLSFSLVILVGAQALAQSRTVTGTVTDQSDQSTLAGVNIVVKGTGSGTTTGADGRFSLEVPDGSNVLVFSFVGFATLEAAIPASNFMTISLEPSSGQLEELVVSVGSRGSQRTITDTPLPVDVLSNREINSTGQYTFDKALQYRVPAFNTVQTPVNDATSLLALTRSETWDQAAP